MEKVFKTFQPSLVQPNRITERTVFNGICLIREYLVTVTELDEPVEVLRERLLKLWESKSHHSSDILAMEAEAKKLGIELPD